MLLYTCELDYMYRDVNKYVSYVYETVVSEQKHVERS